MRAHIALPEDLVKEVDALTGPRKRSAFIEEAVREKLRRANMLAALDKYAGVLKAEDYPDWSTPEKVTEWVRYGRDSEEAMLTERRGGTSPNTLRIADR